MSPEQIRAIAALREGKTVPEAIDGRSDIYSLGLVLYEALGGRVADANQGKLSPLCRCNPQVPPGLSDIVAKCLAPEPKSRYRDAGALAADLWGHLNDLPLKGVANRSITERWRKWRRRKPHLLSYVALSALMFVVAGAALAFALVHVGYRVDEARQAVADGQEYVTKERYPDAINTLKRGLSQLENLPGHEGLKAQLASRLDVAIRAQKAYHLHQIADGFRVLYGMDPNSSARFRVLEEKCCAIWDQRELILDRLGKELDPEIEQRIRLDFLDLAILGSNLRVGLAGAERVGAARRGALRVLDQAEALFGPNAVLYHERRVHAQALGFVEVARESQERASICPPRTAWEHYALGRALMQDGDLEAAAAQLKRALANERGGLWPNFYLGICNYRLGRFAESAQNFTVCTTLSPSAGCFFNRALAYAGLGSPELALRDVEQARELDVEFARAALNQAAADWQRALDGGANPASAHFHLALICLAQKDQAGAIAHLEQGQESGLNQPQASGLLKSLRNQQ
jgi:tetratricopeptide (TPR) repeat protein